VVGSDHAGVPGSLVGGGTGLFTSLGRSRRPRVPEPLAAFLAAETTGALVLVAATAVAIVWANIDPAAYESLWHVPIELRVGGVALVGLDLRHWINDALMALFFFVVGLEIKRELVDGELADRRRAALPVFAALGGMVVPALIYLAFNAGGPAARGWGIPIATDIAFAVGALALIVRSAPPALRLFLLAVAIADDIGSIVVIALAYSGQVAIGPLVAAALLLVLVVALWRTHRPWSAAPLAVLMVLTWGATLASGVHPTIAGVALGLVTPAGASPDPSPAERLERVFHPWTSYVVIPVFALANAGVVLDGAALTGALASPITLGIAFGLVFGKLIGVSGGAFVAVRLGVGSLPRGLGWGQVVGAAALAGIGFTVSLFIAGLSFSDGAQSADAKVGILAGSILATVIGAVLLRRLSPVASANERRT